MGRHRTSQRGTGWLIPALVMIGATVGVTALVIAGTIDARPPTDAGVPAPTTPGSCSRTVRVVTSSSFAPVLTSLAPALAAGTDCVGITVEIADGRAAAARAAEPGVDVWIPDDASWAGVAGTLELAPDGAIGSRAVLATSPIFMVTDSATAHRIGDAGSSWLGLARLLDAGSGVRLAVRDPASSGDGLVAAAALGEAVWLNKGMDASSLALANIFRNTRTVTGTEPAVPTAAGEVGLVPEYALVGALARMQPDVSFLAGTDYAAMLRFTWLPMATAVGQPEREAALRRLLAGLTGADAAKAFATSGLRGPAADVPPPGASGRLPVLSAKPFAVIGPHHVDHVFATWYQQDRRMNLLIVVDISGSMAAPPPGSTTPLIDLIRLGCQSVGTLLPDNAAIGLWEFGVALDGPRDYRIALPTGPLTGSQRQALSAAVNGLTSRRIGTGLYDTMLAAYQSARDSYQPGVPNQVLLFTDGHNEGDPNSITPAQLAAKLAAAKDPARPVELNIVTFGQPADVAVLKDAVKPVDGYVAAIHSADEVAAVFIHVAAGGLHA